MEDMMSDFLFARPSFCEGISRIVDFGNTFNEYNSSPSGEVADALALRMDWLTVGFALQSAMKEYVEKAEAEKESSALTSG